jgi:hypothetical protein
MECVARARPAGGARGLDRSVRGHEEVARAERCRPQRTRPRPGDRRRLAEAECGGAPAAGRGTWVRSGGPPAASNHNMVRLRCPVLAWP